MIGRRWDVRGRAVLAAALLAIALSAPSAAWAQGPRGAPPLGSSGGQALGGLGSLRGLGGLAGGAIAVQQVPNAVQVVAHACTDPAAANDATLRGTYGFVFQSANMVGRVISGDADKVLQEAENGRAGILPYLGARAGEWAGAVAVDVYNWCSNQWNRLFGR